MRGTKARKKKDGRDKGKKTQAMRRAVKQRKAKRKPPKPSTDQPDIQEFKPGAPSDRNAPPQ